MIAAVVQVSKLVWKLKTLRLSHSPTIHIFSPGNKGGRRYEGLCGCVLMSCPLTATHNNNRKEPRRDERYVVWRRLGTARERDYEAKRRFCLDPGLETRNEEETMRDKERGYIVGASE